jgi:hypothetical protein
MSDTPRTDEFLNDALMDINVAEFHGSCRVRTLANFTRQLERENAKTRKLVEQLSNALLAHAAKSLCPCPTGCFCWKVTEMLEEAERGG